MDNIRSIAQALINPNEKAMQLPCYHQYIFYQNHKPMINDSVFVHDIVLGDIGNHQSNYNNGHDTYRNDCYIADYHTANTHTTSSYLPNIYHRPLISATQPIPFNLLSPPNLSSSIAPNILGASILGASMACTFDMTPNWLNVGFFIHQSYANLILADWINTDFIHQSYPQQLIYRPKNSLNRQDFLWEKTCFECFIAISDKAYLEINANSHQYAVYEFDDYRTPNTMPPPSTKKDFDFMVINGMIADRYFFGFCIQFDNPINIVAINPTAIIYNHNQPYFFAHKHATTPDFHHQAYWLSIH